MTGAIRLFWHNVKSALARVKTAMVVLRVPPQASLKGGVSNLRVCSVQALKVGASGDGEAVVVAKEYPRPTRERS